MRVLITGAAHGLGRACALAFARQGHELVLCDNDGPALREISASIGAHARFCDVASEASVSIFLAGILADFEVFDVLVNAAGTGHVRSMGMMRISLALMPALRRAQGEAVIFNIASGGTNEPGRCVFAYADTQSAFARLSEALSLNVRGSSVSVATIVPKPRGPALTSAGTVDPVGDANGNRNRLVERINPAKVAQQILSIVSSRRGYERPGKRRLRRETALASQQPARRA